MSELIKFKNVKKTYNIGEKSFNALDGVDFSIDKGEFVIILGQSGTGKSTCKNSKKVQPKTAFSYEKQRNLKAGSVWST